MSRYYQEPITSASAFHCISVPFWSQLMGVPRKGQRDDRERKYLVARLKRFVPCDGDQTDGEAPRGCALRVLLLGKEEEVNVKLTRFWRVLKRGSLSHGGDEKRKNVRFPFTEDVT